MEIHRLRRTAVAAAAAALSAAAVPGQSPAPAPSGTAIVAGRVVEAGSDRPVEEAVVSLSSPTGQRRVMVDALGRFVFMNVPAGRYRLEADQFGYLPGSFGRIYAGGPGASIGRSARSSKPASLRERPWRS